MAEKSTETFHPSSKAEWRDWLTKNHDKAHSVWLIFNKVATGNVNLTWSEAVDEALCFGWIDSVKRSIDSEKYMQYFGRRKPSSTWSKVNKDKIEKLTAEGLMCEAGIRSVEIAQQNGNWSILDDVENLILPDDLEEQMAKYPDSKIFFSSLNKAMKKGLLSWIVLAKREETRKKRIKEIIESTKKGELPKRFQ
ncbi:hypothetical protein EMN47_19955 [Prolixibacteraceae bacterium JC049]|nr:hypothetical protein [Prolixibacteraceae bacterium JC049]